MSDKNVVRCRLVPTTFVLGAMISIASHAHAAEMPTIPLPNIPSREFVITKYGAVGDGKTLNTKAIQKAIDACGQAGGGTVLIPTGRFLTGPLTLTSNLNLKVDKGSVLALSDNVADYTMTNNRFEDCISAKNCHDISITGEGTIDGQGAFWWSHYVKPKNAPADAPALPHRPFLVVLTRCERVLVRDIHLKDSPMFHLVPQQCQNVRIDHISINSPDFSKNTDGLDPAGWNFLITNCTFDVGDDCIALKPSGLIEPGQPSCKNFLITKCTFLHGHGMSVGGQTPGGLTNMRVSDCTFKGTDAGIRLKAPRGNGGLVENLTYENITMDDVKVPILITSYYANSSPGETPINPAEDTAQAVTPTTPIWRHIQIRNVTAINSKKGGQIFGLPEMPVSDITLTNVQIAAKTGMEIIHARGIHFVTSHVSATAGTAVILQDAQITGMDRSGNSVASATAPVRVFNIVKYGAIGDGKTKNTDAFEKTITACVAAGGGQVLVPDGIYLTGPIQLRSNVDLHLATNAQILFSRNHEDYPLILTHYEGLPSMRCMSPIWGENLQNVSITGNGVIDGQGETWRPAHKAKMPEDQWNALVASGGIVDDTDTWWPSRAASEGAKVIPSLLSKGGTLNPEDFRPYRDYLRPTLIELSGCQNVVLDGPEFRNSPNWNIHVLLSDHVRVHNITSFTHWYAQNGDGIDFDSCRDVAMTDSFVSAGDDGICLKSGKDEEGRRLGRPTENVTIKNCTVYRGHGGVTIGSEMSGGVRNVRVSDCVFDGTDIGLRFKSTRGRGGIVEDIQANHILMSNISGAAISFDMYYMVKNPQAEPVSERTPRFRQFQISDITCDGAKSAILIRGLPEMPIEGITLENVNISAESGVNLVDAKDITFKGVESTGDEEPFFASGACGKLKIRASPWFGGVGGVGDLFSERVPPPQ